MMHSLLTQELGIVTEISARVAENSQRLSVMILTGNVPQTSTQESETLEMQSAKIARLRSERLSVATLLLGCH